MKKMIVMSIVVGMLSFGVVVAGPNCGNHKEDDRVTKEEHAAHKDHDAHKNETTEEHAKHKDEGEHSSCSGHGHDNRAIKEDKGHEKQSQCPVMGNDIDKKVFVDHDGHRIYACSEACKLMIGQDFETYEEKLEELGQELEEL